ncbi:hypothetical protein COU14_00770, partial [Candidatus Kaiserbacteria bacterium CG10_big_fil_rev_8_21_14_0_10_44_10]
VYLNEFDRFVRHHIKPLGYLRYGDDFVLFMNSQRDATCAQSLATGWLFNLLKLNVHKKNNIIIRPSQGLYFLGHHIYPSGISVDRIMAGKISQKIDRQNAGNYQAMHLSSKQAKQLPWLLR